MGEILFLLPHGYGYPPTFLGTWSFRFGESAGQLPTFLHETYRFETFRPSSFGRRRGTLGRYSVLARGKKIRRPSTSPEKRPDRGPNFRVCFARRFDRHRPRDFDGKARTVQKFSRSEDDAETARIFKNRGVLSPFGPRRFGFRDRRCFGVVTRS